MNNRINRSNFFHLVVEVGWFGLAFAATSRFLSVYAIRLNATSFELGLLAGLPWLFFVLGTAIVAWWRRRFPNSLKALYLPTLLFRFVFIAPFFAPFLPESWQIPYLIASVVLTGLPQGMGSAIFVVMLREAVSDEDLTRLWSRRLVALNITLALSTRFFGYMLESVPFPRNYQLMFGLAFIFALLSLVHVLRVKLQFSMPVAPPPSPIQRQRLWRSPNFLIVAFVILVTHLSFFVAQPFIPLHLVDNLGATEDFIAWFGLAELGAGATIALFTDRLMRWMGSRVMLSLAMFLTALSVVIVAVTNSLPLTLVSSALTGAGWTMVGVSVFSFFLERISPENMQAGSTLYHEVLGVALFAGSIFGSLMTSGGMSLVTMLILGAVLRFAASYLVMETRWGEQRLKQYAMQTAPGD